MQVMTWDNLYKNFKTLYPRLSKSSVYFRPSGYMQILIYFKDGMKMIYDDIKKQASIVGK